MTRRTDQVDRFSWPQLEFNLKLLVVPRLSHAPWNQDLSNWLTRRELEELQCFRNSNRRDDWLSGRWCGKKLLGDSGIGSNEPMHWEILSRESATRGCRPSVFHRGVRHNTGISIAHCQTLTVAAISQTYDRVGVDVVDNLLLPGSFTETWFSSAERSLMERASWETAVKGWAAKEAVFKASNEGEPFRPRQLHLLEIHDDQCLVRYPKVGPVQVRFESKHEAMIAVATVASKHLRILQHENHTQETTSTVKRKVEHAA